MEHQFTEAAIGSTASGFRGLLQTFELQQVAQVNLPDWLASNLESIFEEGIGEPNARHKHLHLEMWTRGRITVVVLRRHSCVGSRLSTSLLVVTSLCRLPI
jgi:hypothetical protein